MTLLLLLSCRVGQAADPEVWSPHRAMVDPANPKPCVMCHADGVPEEGPLETVGNAALCMGCHTGAPHAGAALHLGPLPEAMVPHAKEAGLPLTTEGEVVLLACHDPHPPGATERSTARAGWSEDVILPESWVEEVLQPSLQERSPDQPVEPVTRESPLVRLPLTSGRLCRACHRL